MPILPPCFRRWAADGGTARMFLRIDSKGRDSMTSKEVRARIEETGIVAAVRVYSADEALFAAEAVVGGGIPAVEITLTVPQATKVISQLVKTTPHIVVGAGGVTDAAAARQCLDAGAQ